MGFIFNFVRKLVRLSIYVFILLTLIAVIPNIPPYTSFTSIPLEPPLPREGPLAPNNDLNNAQKLYLNKLEGPEDFQIHRNELYTSLATGEIVKVSPGGHVTFVTKIGQPCTGLIQEHICGRPLGFVIDESKDLLYVADAYHGIWKVNLKNDKKQLLVSPRVAIEGRNPKLFNSIVLGKNGDFYWTDSSSDFQLRDGAISALCDPSGRLFHYNAAKNESKVLLDKLWFSNGLVMSPDQKFLVVAETSRLRLMKYYIDGPKKGQSEVLIAGLPGLPDNLRALPDGSGILIGLYSTYDDQNPLLLRSLSETPVVRKVLARVQRLVEIPFEYINTVFPHFVFQDIVYNIGHFRTTSDMLPKMSGLMYIDWNGKVISSHYNTDGSVSHISDAIVYNDMLYTGNPHAQKFIGAVPVPPALKKAFETKGQPSKPTEAPKPKAEPKVEVKKEVKKETPKPQEKPVQKPKPTEAPKPTTPPPTVKPTEAPKTTTPPPTPKKSTEAPKPTKPMEKPTPKPATPKTTEQPKPAQKPAPAKTDSPKPKEEKVTTPKPEVKSTPTTPPPKAQTKTEKTKSKPAEAKPSKPAPEQIPIKEEIPSDTAKPVKENLKVIKKGGPTEIPNPHL